MTKVDKLEDGMTELNKQVEETKAASEQAKEDCKETCKVRCKAQEDKLLYAEVYSWRKNLHFYGFNGEGDQEGTLAVLIKFLETQPNVTGSNIEFQWVHRIGKINKAGCPRPIISRFLHYCDWEFIFSKILKELKGADFEASANFPKEITYRGKLQEKKMKDARQAGRRAFFSRAEPDKLCIDGVLVSL